MQNPNYSQYEVHPDLNYYAKKDLAENEQLRMKLKETQEELKETREELKNAKHDLTVNLILKHDVIHFALSFEDYGIKRIDHRRPSHQIWQEFQDRVVGKFSEARRLKDENEHLRMELKETQVELENAKAAERGWELQAEHGFKQLKQLEGQNQKLKNKLETLGVKSV